MPRAACRGATGAGCRGDEGEGGSRARWGARGALPAGRMSADLELKYLLREGRGRRASGISASRAHVPKCLPS